MFCECAKGLALKQRYGDIRVLVQAIQKSHSGIGKSDSLEVLNDDIIIAAIKVLANQSKEVCVLVKDTEQRCQLVHALWHAVWM